jgi:signal transduction histidine kinase
MVSLLGYLEYLKLDYGEALGDEGGRYVERIFDRALYMQRLINDLIELSRAGRASAEPVEVDLGDVARTVVDQAAAAYPAARFEVQLLPTVVGDPVGFRQLLTNLVENAVRHGGRPDVTVTVAGGGHPDGSLELNVSDDGKGIPPEHRERVFGVFERLDGASPGTGMGLAICRKIVELLGGTIAIHGQVGPGGPDGPPGGTGTRVRIMLPPTVATRWPNANGRVTDQGEHQGALV